MTCPALFVAGEEGDIMAEGMPKISLDIDVSDVTALLNRMQSVMTAKQYENALRGILNRTGRHVSAILKKDLPQKYHVATKDIGQAVKKPRLTPGSAFGIGCIIPIQDRRGSIGGSYKATGGARGWQIPAGGYRVSAKIVKSGKSVLPVTMPKTANMKPFRNLSASKLNKVTFSRLTTKRLPIRKVVGIGIPQMPMNRSREEVQKDIHDYLVGRIEARLQAFIKNGR